MEGIVEVGSSNEMSAVVLDQRVCTGRPLLERKNLRRSLGNCCLSRRWLRETAFSSILSRMITPMPGSHSNHSNKQENQADHSKTFQLGHNACSIPFQLIELFYITYDIWVRIANQLSM